MRVMRNVVIISLDTSIKIIFNDFRFVSVMTYVFFTAGTAFVLPPNVKT